MPSRLAISSADSPEPRRNALSRLPISSKRTGIGERSVGQIVCRALGLLPPPRNPGLPGLLIILRKSGRPDLRWGRGGEGGNNKFGACCYPPPRPSPTGGEGTLRPEPLRNRPSVLRLAHRST